MSIELAAAIVSGQVRIDAGDAERFLGGERNARDSDQRQQQLFHDGSYAGKPRELNSRREISKNWKRNARFFQALEKLVVKFSKETARLNRR
jgi:hypothetical protein